MTKKSSIKYICFILVSIFIISCIPMQVFSAVMTEEEFKNYLISQGRYKTGKGYTANYNTYKTYNQLIVYGSPWGDESYSKSTGRNERRYLGYTFNDEPYTNSFFPPDATGGNPTSWKYEDVGGAVKSWADLDKNQELYMLNSSLSYSGTAYPTIKVNTIGGIDKALVQSKAAWSTGFSIRTEHYSGGILWYATLYGPNMGGCTLKTTVSTPSNTYTIKAEDESVTVPVTVKTDAALTGTYVDSTQIKNIKATFEDSTGTRPSSTTVSTTKDKILDRKQYKPGTYSITLNGQSSLDSIFGDFYMSNGSKTITLIVEEEPDLKLDITAKVTPERKKVDGSKDETVKVDISASIVGSVKLTDIKEWVFYARLTDEDDSLQQINLPGGTKSSSASFTFTVKKSKFNVQTFTQMIKTTATARLQRSIKNETFVTKSKDLSSVFYKEEPPPPEPPTEPTPENLPPVAIINAPSVVYAGDNVVVDGSQSYDPDGTIEQYMWSLPGANIIFTADTGAVVTYPSSGIFSVFLVVIDDKGAVGTAWHSITVMEPYPQAIINISGVLKQNRKVSIDSFKSITPANYPIDTTKTVWEITHLDGALASDIKYSGYLTGISQKDMIFKKPGRYEVKLKVTNTAGYSNATTTIVNIIPDEPPKAQFSTAEKVLRDAGNSGLATIELNCSSYSNDADTIAQRIWEYAYDSNNDGSFTGETWVTFDNRNNATPSLDVLSVGKYKIRLTVKEEFGQETIPAFMQPSDYLTDTCEMIVEVINTAPVADFSMIKKKLADIVLLTDYTGQKLADLTSKLNALKADLYSIGTEVQFNVVGGNNKKEVGSLLERKIYYQGLDYTKYLINYVNTMIDGSRTIYTIKLFDEPTTYDGLSNVRQVAGYGIPYYIENGVERPYNLGNNKSWVALDSFGNVWTKGDNTYGQLGDGTNISSDTWKKVNGLNNIVQIAGTGRYFLALASDNTLYFWGIDYYYAVTPENLYPRTVVSYNTPVVVTAADKSRISFPSELASIGTHAGGFGGYASVAANSSASFHIRYEKKESYWDGEYTQTRRSLTSFSWLIWLGFDSIIPVDTKTTVNTVNSDSIKSLALRNNSDRHFIYVSDGQGEDYSQGFGNYYGFSSLSSEFLNTILQENCSTYAVCPEASYDYKNESFGQDITIRNLINNSVADGRLFAKGQFQQALDHIKTKYTAATDSKITQYVIANEDEVTYETFYSDAENDPKYSERWKFTHDNTVYDNNLGKIPTSGQWVGAPVDSFIRVGKYDITFQVRDNPKFDDRFDNYRLWSDDAATQLTVYAHRRPIADFKVSFTGKDGSGNYITYVQNNSYDMDHTSRAGRGIAANQWKWKELNASTWTTGTIPSILPANKKYIVQLMVKDIEGAWSKPSVQIIETIGNDFPPTVDADPTSLTIRSNTASITVTVTADDKGENDFKETRYRWTTTTAKPTSGWSVNTNKVFNTALSTQGTYYLHMEAFDQTGNSFYRYRGPYTILPDTPPTVDANPTSARSDNPITVIVTADDKGENDFKETRYRWTTTTAKPTSGWSVSTNKIFNTTLSTDGTYYLHMEVFDKGGNSFYRYRGPYTLETLKITGVTIEGYWNHWRGQVNLFGKRMSVEPHRFLSLERVKINVNTTGYADKVEIRFSPELEAMRFKDKYGNIYDYKNDFKLNYVYFPKIISLDSSKKDNNVYWEYILPLAGSTKSWEDVRAREPYIMEVTAWKGTKSVKYTISDINITGNIYDLTYIQPLN